MWYVYLIIAVLLMSANVFIVKRLVKKVKPVVILFYQYLIATPLVLTYALINGSSLTNYPITLLGFLYVLGIGLFYQSLIKGDLSKAGPVFNLKMLVPALLGLIFLREELTLNLVIGLIFGVIGVWLLGGVKK